MTEAHYADVCLRNLKQIYLHWAGISNRFDFSPKMRANKVMNKGWSFDVDNYLAATPKKDN